MAFTIYSASAGSGKTYTLVNEYLSLTLPDPRRFPQVLAITFTNKAAAQMKSRILQALAELRQNKDPARLQTLQAMTGLPAETLKIQAGQLMSALLHQYGDYAVMTIDSFIIRVVRAFSFDLGLPQRFDVELSQERVTALLVERIIAQAREGQRSGDILKRFILEKIHSQQNWNYEEELLATTRQRFNDRSLTAINALLQLPEQKLADMENLFTRQMRQFREQVNDSCRKILDEINALGLGVDDFAYKKDGIPGQLARLSKARRKGEFEIKKRLRDGVWFTKDSQYRQIHQDRFDGCIEPFRIGLLNYIDAELPRYCTLWDIRRSLPTLQLLKEIERELDSLSREDRLVPISQFNRKVARIIEDEVIPYIYLRIGERFQNYLIDEFQDTNQLQWSNLFPLIENVLSEGQKNLVVGDPKQAIYRWRGGDPLIMEERIKASLPTSQLEYKRLTCNYRSLSTVVEFNNRFFGDFRLDPDLPEMERFAGGNVHQTVGVDSQLPGYVEIRFFGDGDGASKNNHTEAAAQWTVDHILRAHRSAPGGGLEYKDMAILIRTKKDAVPLAEALIAAGIPVVTSDSLQLNHYQSVRAVISVLAYLHSRQTIHLLEILAFLEGEEFNAYLSRLPVPDDLLVQVISHLPRFDDWSHSTTILSLYDLSEEICSAFLSRRGKDGSATPAVPLLALLDLIFAQSARLNGDLGTFLDWWQENLDKESTVIANCQSPNGVQILTIHKAKGLEFPMVILPFADWDITSNSMSREPSLWVVDDDNRLGQGRLPYLIPVGSENGPHLFQQDLQREHLNNRIDNLHLLYVAFTRAQSSLLVGLRSVGKGAVSSWIQRRLSVWPEPEDPSCFRLGSLQYAPAAATLPIPETPEEHELFWTWQERLSIRDQAREEWLDPGNPRHQGKLMHLLLSQIRQEEDLDPVLAAALESGLIHADMEPALRAQFNRLLDLPLFDATVRSAFQAPWLVRTEAAVFHGRNASRPDRIQFRDDRIWVIDYKREARHPSHQSQLRSYLDLLQKCHPAHRVCGVLLYLVSGEIVEMDSTGASRENRP